MDETHLLIVDPQNDFCDLPKSWRPDGPVAPSLAGTLWVAGEAGSHCVRATVEHVLERWNGDPSRIVLLEDAMSPVAGCGTLQSEFLEQARARGARVQPLHRTR